MDGDAKPYVLTEAASLTGLSVDSLRKRIARKRLRASRSNEDGQWRVWLTDPDIAAAKAGRLADKSSPSIDSKPDESRTIKALGVVAETLRERAEGQAAAEQARADKAERERDIMRAEAVRAQVAAASAESEAKGLRLALEEARRPFWRRWIG